MGSLLIKFLDMEIDFLDSSNNTLFGHWVMCCRSLNASHENVMGIE